MSHLQVGHGCEVNHYWLHKAQAVAGNVSDHSVGVLKSYYFAWSGLKWWGSNRLDLDPIDKDFTCQATDTEILALEASSQHLGEASFCHLKSYEHRKTPILRSFQCYQFSREDPLTFVNKVERVFRKRSIALP